MKLETVDVGEVSLEIARAGLGGAPLMLLHGFTGAKEDFADFVDPLADRGFDVVAPDLRGHGSSSQPAGEGSYSLDIFAADLHGMADVLGWDRFGLLGHSMGGMVAQRMALARPERLSALVLMDTCSGAVAGIDPELAALAIEVARSHGLEVLCELQNSVQSPLASSADARVRAQRPGYAEFCDRKLQVSSPAMYAAMAGELLGREDCIDDLGQLDLPTLVIVGEQDDGFVGPCRRMAATIPGARLEVVADAGHSPQFEAPDAWWQALHPFLEASLLATTG